MASVPFGNPVSSIPFQDNCDEGRITISLSATSLMPPPALFFVLSVMSPTTPHTGHDTNLVPPSSPPPTTQAHGVALCRHAAEAGAGHVRRAHRTASPHPLAAGPHPGARPRGHQPRGGLQATGVVRLRWGWGFGKTTLFPRMQQVMIPPS